MLAFSYIFPLIGCQIYIDIWNQSREVQQPSFVSKYANVNFEGHKIDYSKFLISSSQF